MLSDMGTGVGHGWGGARVWLKGFGGGGRCLGEEGVRDWSRDYLIGC